LFPSALGEGIKTLKVKDERSGSKNYTLASLGFHFHLSRASSSVERKLPHSLTTYILLQKIMKQRTGSEMISLISMVTVAAVLLILFGQQSTFAQQYTTESQTAEKVEMSNMTSAIGPGGVLPSMSTPGEKTFYVFTAEVENVDEVKLKIAGDSFNVNTLIANKGDKVTVKFYNVDEVQT
jgi:hypothetical protein